MFSSPAVANKMLFVGSNDMNVYALDQDTGAQVWNFTTKDAVYGSPAVGPDGTVYIGSWDYYVYALNGATGYAGLQCALHSHGACAM